LGAGVHDTDAINQYPKSFGGYSSSGKSSAKLGEFFDPYDPYP